MDGLRERIKANGWRQGSILPPDLHAEALKHQRLSAPGDPSALVVLTQDCDLLAHKLDVEPDVEVILGTGPIKQERTLDNSNRQYLIRLSGPQEQGLPGHLLFRDKHRFRIPREWFLEHQPHESIALATTSELRLLLNMVIRRFARPALSDAFNRRLSPAFNRKKDGYELLKEHHRLFRELRWSVPKIMEDLPDSQEYQVEALTAILEEGVDESRALEVLETIQELIRTDCPGIDMGKPEGKSRLILRKPEVLTLLDYEVLLDHSEPWDWEWLSRPIVEGSESNSP